MAGKAQALYENYEGQRSRWFGEGFGRAYIGWTERLSAIPVEQHQDIAIRSLPLGDSDKVNMLYVDMLAISPTLPKERRKLAIEFANLASSKEVVVESFLVQDPKTKSPQYLLPVRSSVISDPELLKAAPLYAQLVPILTENPRAFRIGERSRAWLASNKSEIRRLITETPISTQDQTPQASTTIVPACQPTQRLRIFRR